MTRSPHNERQVKKLIQAGDISPPFSDRFTCSDDLKHLMRRWNTLPMTRSPTRLTMREAGEETYPGGGHLSPFLTPRPSHLGSANDLANLITALHSTHCSAQYTAYIYAAHYTLHTAFNTAHCTLYLTLNTAHFTLNTVQCTTHFTEHCILHSTTVICYDVHWVHCSSIAQCSRRNDGGLSRDFILLTLPLFHRTHTHTHSHPTTS